MSYEIEFTRAAVKTFDKLPARSQRRISAALDKLERNPRPAESRGVAGSESLLRVRVGDRRIVYRIEEDDIILIIRIGHRREVCRNL